MVKVKVGFYWSTIISEPFPWVGKIKYLTFLTGKRPSNERVKGILIAFFREDMSAFVSAMCLLVVVC